MPWTSLGKVSMVYTRVFLGGDHLWQGGPSVAAILGLAEPSMAAKIAVHDPGGLISGGPSVA